MAIIPYQLFYLSDDCDVMSTSGIMVGSFPFNIVLLFALRWAATGDNQSPFLWANDYTVFWVLMAADFILGLVDSTLLNCNPEGALLEQVPGKPWVLKNW